MKKYFLILAVFTSVGFHSFGNEPREVQKQTTVYSIKDADTLRMDIYTVQENVAEPRPCLMFVFGGGFIGGNRDREAYTPYFEYFARAGYSVVSIDYRLGLSVLLKPEYRDSNKKFSPRKFVELFENAIYIAVEDLFDATSYLVDHHDRLGIDPAMIIASGSSAGAITVLQGEYYICNGEKLVSHLPEKFNYAGIISFAGAIYNNGKLKWKNKPCPIQLFHGDADKNVPYNKMEVLGSGLYGSLYIKDQLAKMENPYWFYSVTDASHKIAITPMNDKRDEISNFMENMVKEGRQLRIDTYDGKESVPPINKKFKIKDYVKSNFHR